MLSAMPNKFSRSLNILSIFHLTISPSGDALNGSLTYLHLPNRQPNIVKYEFCLI